jgi:transmembrane sensor
MIDLNARLQKGPLRVRREWKPGPRARGRKRAVRRRRLVLVVGVLSVTAALALLVTRLTHKSSAPWALGQPESTAMHSVSFADGSLAELTDDQAQVKVEEDGPRRVVTSVTVGARFRVVPNPQRTFEVRSGSVLVRVLGTTFSVREHAAGTARVAVEHGRVQVEWPGGAATLDAGQSGVFPPPKAAESQPSDVPPVPSARTAPDVTAKPPWSDGATPSWRDYAMKGDYDKAYVVLSEKGKGSVRDEPADLMLAADVARLSSHPAEAVAPLRKLCDKYPADKRAPIAAFTLGRVLLDDLGRASEAAGFFEKARTLWPSGPIAQEALAREAEAQKRAKNPQRAQALAGQYLRQYPQGAYSAPMRKLLEP